MESQKDKGAVNGGVAKQKKSEADDDVELIDGDVSDFFEEGDSVDRRRDPLRDPLAKI